MQKEWRVFEVTMWREDHGELLVWVVEKILRLLPSCPKKMRRGSSGYRAHLRRVHNIRASFFLPLARPSISYTPKMSESSCHTQHCTLRLLPSLLQGFLWGCSTGTTSYHRFLKGSTNRTRCWELLSNMFQQWLIDRFYVLQSHCIYGRRNLDYECCCHFIVQCIHSHKKL